jgi:hypothetical protein
MMNDPDRRQSPQEELREASNQLRKVAVWLVVAIVAAMLVAFCALVLTVISWG